MKNQTPIQSMREFFARADVKALQDIQKVNRFGSKAHRDAYEKMVSLAKEIGAERFFDGY